jgi:hypothetical protein
MKKDHSMQGIREWWIYNVSFFIRVRHFNPLPKLQVVALARVITAICKLFIFFQSKFLEAAETGSITDIETLLRNQVDINVKGK